MRQFRNKNQKLVFDYYKSFIEANQYCCSLEEMEADPKLGITMKTISEHRKTLKEDGVIDYTPGASRSVVILCQD